jgi:hypothetical protein
MYFYKESLEYLDKTILTSIEKLQDTGSKKEFYKLVENWIKMNLGVKIHIEEFNRYLIMYDVNKKVIDRRNMLKDLNLEILEEKLYEHDRNNEDSCNEIQKFIEKQYNIINMNVSPKYCNNEIIDMVIEHI